MKFNKQFSAYIKTQQSLLPGLSYVEFKSLKKLLKHCPLHESSARDHGGEDHKCPPSCAVCDQTFFPLLMKEVAAVMGCFNARVEKLLEMHLASGVHKYMLRLRYRHARNHQDMIHEGQKLVSYVHMNALAIRKILKKYDKVHLSRKGRAFKSRLQTMHVELLQSPWMIELIAFHLNLKENACASPEMFAHCSYNFESSKPTISCTLSDSVVIEIDLTCSICLEMVFDPVSLRCGHIFCNSCARSAASVPTVAGLKSADRNAKCPLCRQARVYEDAVHLTELGTLISTRCKDYWENRLQRERVERLEQVKKHWNDQCRAALGI